MNIIKLLPLLFLFACATVVHPTGGPKDESAPQVLKSSPDSNQTNFNEREIQIQFDEYVEIKDPNAFVISPPTKEKPKLSIRGKSLVIKFKEELTPNTTYIIQLNNLVQDITEKNILAQQEFRFSTGPIIDTLSMVGYIYDHITHEPLQDVTVALFNANIGTYPDSIIFPLFLSRTNADGSFKLDGLPSDSFTLYAFQDINFNNKYENGEKFAYYKRNITPNDSNEIYLYLASNEKQKNLKLGIPNKRDYHSFYLPFSQNTLGKLEISSSIKSFDKTQKIYHQLIHPDTLLIYDSYKSAEDTVIDYYFQLDNISQDTLQVEFDKNHITSYRIPNISKNTLEPSDSLYIQFYAPLIKTNPSKIHLLKDSIEISNIKIANSLYHSYLLFYPESKSNYTLIIQDSAYTTLDHQKSGADTFHFTTPDYSKYGEIQVKWEGNPHTIYKIELLKDKSKKAEYVLYSSSDSINFIGIAAGTYYARVSVSNEGSTTHVIPFKKQPKSYYYHPKTLDLRGSWSIKDVFINIKEK